ncbi:MAG: RICIN domain-containing protein [Saprospiraceae bacterium]|nr:RICIN domain-containing protein [Lewinella sp.]
MKYILQLLLSFGLLLSAILLHAQPRAGKTYYVKMATGSLYLCPANGEALDRVLMHIDNKTATNREDFRWQLLEAGAGWYYLIHEASGLAMDVQNGNGILGNNLWLWPRNNGDAQKFRFVSNTSGTSYKLVSKLNSSLRVGADMSNRNLLSLQTDAQFSLQYWAFEDPTEADLGGPIPNFSRMYSDGRRDVFLRRVGERQVFGVMETPQYSLVILGELKRQSGGPLYIDSEYFPVPKGDGRERIAGYPDEFGNIQIEEDGNRISFTQWADRIRNDHNLPATRDGVWTPPATDAGFQAVYGAGLSGLWLGDDGGRYYLFQTDDARVIWFGEQSNERPRFANVFVGDISDGLEPPNEFGGRREREYTLTGQWVDVPKGTTTGTGELSFQGSSKVLRKLNGRGFGATRLVRQRYLHVEVKHLTAKTEDACGEMDFYGRIRIGDQNQQLGVVTGNDIAPNWRVTGRWTRSEPIAVVISIRDKDDGIRCGGEDDKVDINPQHGSDSEERAFDLYLEVHPNGTIFQLNKDGSRGSLIGNARFNITRDEAIIVLEGDTYNRSGFGKNVAASGGASREECARIEFEVTWSYLPE